ncbi:hypothetical protein VNO77_35302 [Canavalia gladiata]|uniref:FBD domain-containing protein n=1 Tax=Canavalia gladiata TaxID=3824 RepID=A0AAN9Q090_CANGL
MLKVVSNAQVLRIHGMSNSQNEEDVNIVNGIDKKHAIPVYHRLTYIQFNYMEYKKDWIAAVDLLKYCPKLEALVIEKRDVPFIWEDDGEIVNWLYPQSDSECISSHLKICTLKNYKGFKSEFQFAAYIMQNARFLRTMKICSTADHPWEKFRMLKELSSCTRCSKTCELSFE